MTIVVQRAYEARGHAPSARAARVLVDRLWPRGISKDELPLDAWAKDAAPSDGLRKWFGHDPERWREFVRRYFAELDAHPEATEALLDVAKKKPLTLVFGAKDEEHNNAVALKEYLERALVRGRGRRAARAPSRAARSRSPARS